MWPRSVKRARCLQSNPENPAPNGQIYDPGGCSSIGVNTLVDQVFSGVGMPNIPCSMLRVRTTWGTRRRFRPGSLLCNAIR